MNNDSDSDESKCPLCGNRNACQNIVSDKVNSTPCWCDNTAYEFPDNLLNQIPEKFKNKACICQSCAQSYLKTK